MLTCLSVSLDEVCTCVCTNGRTSLAASETTCVSKCAVTCLDVVKNVSCHVCRAGVTVSGRILACLLVRVLSVYLSRVFKTCVRTINYSVVLE